MTGRCIICSDFIFCDEKREKTTVLIQCPSCKGRVELMSSGKLNGEHPFYPEKTFTSKLYEGPYHYAYKNQQGEFFVWKDDKMIKIENPVIAVTNPIQS